MFCNHSGMRGTLNIFISSFLSVAHVASEEWSWILLGPEGMVGWSHRLAAKKTGGSYKNMGGKCVLMLRVPLIFFLFLFFS